ncbi:MAG: MFS transporter [Chloroflexi bacterium]|nr:MAG: MFS transporter [Chloroflexota bacterium]
MILPGIGLRLAEAGKGRLVAKLFYFVFYAAIGSLAPFFNVYLHGAGLSGQQIGLLSGLLPLVALVASPFWGALADRWQIHRQVLALCAFVSGGISLLFLPFSGFWALVGLVVLLSFFRTPIPAIVDASVMDLVKQTGSSYGRQRLWGSLGFVLLSFGLGRLVVLTDLAPIFWLHGLLLGIGCGLLGLLLPIERRENPTGLWEGLGVLIGRPGFGAFLVALVLAGIALSGYINFLSLHMMALGGSEAQVGLAWALAAILEIPMMAFGSRWMGRFSQRRLILTGFVGFAAVWLVMGLATTPTALLLAIPFSGASYAIFWMAAVGYTAAVAPPGMGATAQALTGAAQAGLGWAIGSVLAGSVWDVYGGEGVYLVSAAVMLAAAGVFAWGSRTERE